MRSNFTIDSRVIAVMEMDCTSVEKVIAQCPESGISCDSGAASAVICNGMLLYALQCKPLCNRKNGNTYQAMKI